MQRSHAIANGVYVCAVNRVGHEGDRQGWHRVLGRQLRRRPRWTDTREGRAQGDEVLTVDCDLGKVDVSRTHWPFLRDRRIDAYGDLTRRYHRLSEARGHALFSPPFHLALSPCRPSRRSGLLACPPNGSRIAAPGSAGLTRRRPGPGSSGLCPGSSLVSPATSPIMKRSTSTCRVRSCGPRHSRARRGRRGPASHLLPRNPDERRLVPRSWPDLRPACTHGRHESAILDWGYNAWGGKYPPYDLDDVVRADCRRAGLTGVRARHRSRGRIDRREWRGPCSRPRRVSSIPIAIRSSAE